MNNESDSFKLVGRKVDITCNKIKNKNLKENIITKDVKTQSQDGNGWYMVIETWIR